MEFHYNSRKIKFNINYSKRKSVVISIKPPDYIVVKAPTGMDKKKILELVENKGRWIAGKLDQMKYYKDVDKKAYKDGELFMYLGEEYPLKIVIDENMDYFTLTFEEDAFNVVTNNHDKDILRSLMEDFYRHQTRKIIMDRIDYFQQYFIVKPNNVRIKRQKTRWGSCSSLKNLNFNLKLSMAKPSVIDYIVVHEMSHLIHLNHSKEFWKLVESILPGYREEKEWLKYNAGVLTLD